ncbi:peptidoglycan-binding protein [Streptomyces sp. ODS05-4]|uniref:peptidoglycan-binding domain-containing protein n=1 Tax=Streptomyces sp. ODS05-4 TaxID=2944939 RepID=UPI0035B1BC1E
MDGCFGADTRAAVLGLQGCTRISVDGVVGPDTWAKLNHWARSKSHACRREGAGRSRESPPRR